MLDRKYRKDQVSVGSSIGWIGLITGINGFIRFYRSPSFRYFRSNRSIIRTDASVYCASANPPPATT